MKLRILIIIMMVAALLVTGCTKDQIQVSQPIQDGQAVKDQADIDEAAEVDDEKPEEAVLTAIDLKEVQPNEAGEVMVLMYHHVAGDKEDTWVRTVENFKKDLRVLYDKGYRLISLRDFVNNNINIEAGYTPVILTFDDGNQNNFNIIEKDGEFIVDPDSAVGIMEDFYNQHPDFGLEATFFIFYGVPFGQKELVEYKLNYIVDRGMDIGNHTIGHNDLSKAAPDKIQEHLAKHAIKTKEYLPNYIVDTLALPYGGMPKGEDYKYTVAGSYEGVEYHNKAVLMVGWRPSVSPIDINFDPTRIHRVRASEVNVDGVGMYDWLDYFDKNPGRRYISDGNPNTVTVPERLRDRVELSRLGDKELIIYNQDGEIVE